MKGPYRKARVITALLALLSFCIFLLFLAATIFLLQRGDTYTQGPSVPADNNTASTLTLITLVSLFTSVGSAIAFVSTFVL
jgi:hypothetical protein